MCRRAKHMYKRRNIEKGLARCLRRANWWHTYIHIHATIPITYAWSHLLAATNPARAFHLPNEVCLHYSHKDMGCSSAGSHVGRGVYPHNRSYGGGARSRSKQEQTRL